MNSSEILFNLTLNFGTGLFFFAIMAMALVSGSGSSSPTGSIADVLADGNWTGTAMYRLKETDQTEVLTFKQDGSIKKKFGPVTKNPKLVVDYWKMINTQNEAASDMRYAEKASDIYVPFHTADGNVRHRNLSGSGKPREKFTGTLN